MNLNQASQPTERIGIRKRIADLWNSRNRIARLTILVTTGLVLNCCCVIIPLSGKAHSPIAQANSGVNAISAPALTPVQDLSRSTGTDFDHKGDGRVVCKDFNTQAITREIYRVAHIPLDGSAKDGRSCKPLP